MRYFIADSYNVPLKEQPSNGYTQLQAIARIHREIKEIIRLFPQLSFEEAKTYFLIYDCKFREAKHLYTAI